MIKFGTDGWRGRIADDFTFANVRLVTQALIEYLKAKQMIERGIAIGYDHRFQSEDFAEEAAKVISGAGITAYLASHPIPTPALSFSVRNMKLDAGVMITASHNPPEWNGFKIRESSGSSPLPETTQQIEKYLKDTLTISPSSRNIKTFDPDPEYLNKLKSLVDLDLIKTHNLKIIVDAMHGSGAGYFSKLGLSAVEIRGQRDPLFGGVNPEPLPVNLEESISFVKDFALKYQNELTSCIVLDGDADRLAAIDGSGRFINTHHVFALLLTLLVVHRKLQGEVVKTFNMSNLIDKLCAHYHLPLTVTPIGFKHIAKLIMERNVLLGGEESGGMSVMGFIPERDGILNGLLLLELVAREKKTFAQILDEIMAEYGYYYYDRMDLHLDQAQEVVKKLSSNPPKELAKMKVAKVETLDGLKLSFEDESWILFRSSGTEPLLRIYVEGRSEEEVKLLLGAGEGLVSA